MIDQAISLRFFRLLEGDNPIAQESAVQLAQATRKAEAAALARFAELVEKHPGGGDAMLFNVAVSDALVKHPEPKSTETPLRLDPTPEPSGVVTCTARFGGFCWTCRGATAPGRRIHWVKVNGKSYVAHEACGFSGSFLRAMKKAQAG